jgi:hypothetical protein
MARSVYNKLVISQDLFGVVGQFVVEAAEPVPILSGRRHLVRRLQIDPLPFLVSPRDFVAQPRDGRKSSWSYDYPEDHSILAMEWLP